MSNARLRDIAVQRINKMVMETDDTEVLSAWLEEEKADARRLSALTRIYHRLSQVRREKELRELIEIAVERVGRVV